MTRNANRARRLLLLALPGVLTISCGSGIGDEPHLCTKIGGETGVSVKWTPSDFTDSVKGGSASLVARLCAQGICESRTTSKNVDTSEQFMNVALGDDFDKRTASVRFTLTARGDSKRVLFDERTDVDMRKMVPNGKGCPPTFYYAGLSADPERG